MMSSKYHLSNRVCSIDFVKGIAAILIVCLHCFRLDAIDGLIHIIAKLSVPVFFIITGYYLPDMMSSGRLSIHIRKILKITVLSILLYAFLYVIDPSKGGILNALITVFKSCSSAITSLLLGRVPIDVNAGHLWYLVSILYILVFFSFFAKKESIKKLYFCIPILFFIGYLISSVVDGLDGNSRKFYQNYLFIGFPYVLLGSFIHENNDKIIISNRKLGILFIILFFVYLAELGLYYIVGVEIHREHYLSIIPLVCIVLIWAINNPNFGYNNWISRIGKDYSLYIYIFHYYIVSKLWGLMPHNSVLSSKIMMLLSIVLSVASAFLFLRLKSIIKTLKKKTV